MRSVEQMLEFGSAPRVRRSSIVRVATVALYLWSSGLFFSVSVPLTNSGVVALYGSDFLAIPAFVVAATLMWRGRKSLSRTMSAFVIVYATFFALCLGTFFYRYAHGIVDLQSLVIPRANLTSSAILILLILGLFSARELVLGAYLFAATLAAVAAPLALFDVYLPFSVFENLAIRTDVQLFMMPILLFGLIFRKRLALPASFHWLFAFVLTSLLFSATISGARVNAILVPVLVITGAIGLVFFSDSKRRAGNALVSIAVPLVAITLLIVTIAPTNERVQYGLERNLFFSALSDAITPPLAETGSAPRPTSVAPSTDDSQTPSPAVPDPTNTESDAEQSLEASTSSRAEVWAKAWTGFTDNVVFGTGLRQFPVTYTSGNETFTSIIQPHNFLIEYLMSFGLAGLALWLALLLFWPARAALNAFSESKKSLVVIGLLCMAIAFVFGASFFQPLMLYPNILLVTYFIIGAFSRFLYNESPLILSHTTLEPAEERSPI